MKNKNIYKENSKESGNGVEDRKGGVERRKMGGKEGRNWDTPDFLSGLTPVLLRDRRFNKRVGSRVFGRVCCSQPTDVM